MKALPILSFINGFAAALLWHQPLTIYCLAFVLIGLIETGVMHLYWWVEERIEKRKFKKRMTALLAGIRA